MPVHKMMYKVGTKGGFRTSIPAKFVSNLSDTVVDLPSKVEISVHEVCKFGIVLF